ncbi:MAG TPA: hypothetical protein VJA21_03525 [Verrucomicrobiae bacterium]
MRANAFRGDRKRPRGKGGLAALQAKIADELDALLPAVLGRLSKEKCQMTFSSQSEPELDKRNLALALIQVVQMWSNPRYQLFLNCAQPGELTDDWFSWFVGAWNVARNTKDGRKTEVRKYLDCEFRQALSVEDPAECVDDTALHIQRQGWTSRGCFPVSLVSKVGFFLRPDRLVPLDRFSTQGLNLLRAVNGGGKLKRKSYKAYLNAFDEEYAYWERQLEQGLSEPWVVEMADRLGCPRVALSSVAMRRKVFDDYPMHTGGYGA